MKNLTYSDPWNSPPEGTVSYMGGRDGYTEVETDRIYREVGEIVTEVPAGDYIPGYVRVTTTIYVDTETGILVADIPQYEKWRAVR